MAEPHSDEFHTLQPDPNARSPIPSASSERFDDSDEETIAAGGFAGFGVPSLIEAYDPEVVPQRMVELRIIRSEDLEAALAEVGDPRALPQILKFLQSRRSSREVRGEAPLPVVTEFQAKQILAGNVEKLRLQHYLILDRIGTGGMGEVFRVWNLNLQRLEALKTVLQEESHSVSSTRALERFEQEARVLAALSHPYITTIYHAGKEQGVSFIAMEYVRGKSLKTITEEAFASDERPPVWWAVERVIAISQALQHAHANGVIHRDVKPSNIMITEHNELKVLDLGIARLLHPGDAAGRTSRLTQNATGLGTPEVMPPEQWADATMVTPASDIYSLGCTFFFMLTGRMPYTAENVNGLMFAHLNEPIPQLSKYRPDAPPGLDAVFAKMLAKQLEDRYQSCAELIDALTPFVREGRDKPPRMVAPPPQPPSWNALRWAVAAMVLVVAAAGGLYFTPALLRMVSKGSQEEPKTTKPGEDDVKKKEAEAALAKAQEEQRRKVGEFLAEYQKPRTTIWPTLAQLETFVESQTPRDQWGQEGKLDAIRKAVDRESTLRFEARLGEVLSSLQTKQPDVGPTAEQLRTMAQKKSSSAQPFTDVTFRELVDHLKRDVWQQKSLDWLDKFSKEHALIWKSEKDLNDYARTRFRQEVIDEASCEKLQQLVRSETQKRIQEWPDAWLAEYQAAHRGSWPTLEELKTEVFRLVARAELQNEEALQRFRREVEALTSAIERPFDGVKPFATGDAERDYRYNHLLRVAETLLRIAANDGRSDGLQVELRVKNQTVQKLRPGQTVEIRARSQRAGFMSVMAFQPDGGLQLLQWEERFPANEWQTLVVTTAQGAGSDQAVAFVTEVNLLTLVQPRPRNVSPETMPGWFPKVVIQEYRPDDLAAIRAQFRHRTVYERVLKHLRSGTSYPFEAVAPVTGVRQSFEIRVEDS